MSNVLYRWLHISDLHVFDSTDKEMVLHGFRKLAERFQPDFLVVTGDFRHKRYQESSFSAGLDYLNQIVECFKLDKKNLFMVPGNHDVNSYPFREECIATIRSTLESDSDSYAKYGHDKIGDLYQGFREYNQFVREVYGDALDPTDLRIQSPSDVHHLVWQHERKKDVGVNIILLNTALLSTAQSNLPQISDIRSFSKINLNNDYPTLVLAHHGIDRMPSSHRSLVQEILNKLKVRAYLCGDAHRLGKDGVNRIDISNATIPQFVCGKSAPEPGDRYSDLSVIGYTCKSDGNAYVQVYRFMATTEKGGRAFQASNDFYLVDGKNWSFPMIEKDEEPFYPMIPPKKQVINDLTSHLVSAGDFLIKSGKFDQAMDSYRQSEMLYRREKNDLGLANIFHSMGKLQSQLGKFHDAMHLYQQAEALYKKNESDLGLAKVIQSEGALQMQLGRNVDALELYSVAEILYRKEQDFLNLAKVLGNKAAIYTQLGRVEEALEMYQYAEALFRKESDDFGLAITILSAGKLMKRLGRVDEAMKLYQEAECLFRAVQNDSGLADALKSLGDLQSQMGDLNEAMILYQQAEALYRKMQEPLRMIDTLLSISICYLQIGDISQSKETAREAEELSELIQYPYGIEIADELQKQIYHKDMAPEMEMHVVDNI